MGPMINDCEARSDVWRDIAKIFSTVNNSSSSSSRQQTDPAPQQIEFKFRWKLFQNAI